MVRDIFGSGATAPYHGGHGLGNCLVWDDDDDLWLGRCLVAYKLLLVATRFLMTIPGRTTFDYGEHKDSTHRQPRRNCGKMKSMPVGRTAKRRTFSDSRSRSGLSGQQRNWVSRQSLYTQEQTLPHYTSPQLMWQNCFPVPTLLLIPTETLSSN